ncbi:MAG: hypothetical protein COA70_01235 [Planctomycetota bacterium]|nr:MAG: hypothetical protein COA70_01235 [Planctomycetota bacterium]
MRFFLSALLALTGFSFLSAQETPNDSPTVVVSGQGIVQNHALLRDLKFALVAYPLTPDEAQYAKELFPTLESWARMNPGLWFANQAKDNQVDAYLAMPVWQEANLDGRAILALQLKVQLVDEFFSYILGNEDYIDYSLDTFIEQAQDKSLSEQEQASAQAKIDYFRLLNDKFKAHPLSDVDDYNFAHIVGYGLGERSEALMKPEGLPIQGPLLFQFPETPFAFHAGPEWEDTFPGKEDKNRFHIPDTLLVADFFQFTLEAPRNKWDLFFAQIAEQTVSANEGSELIAFQSLRPHGDGFHAYYDVVFADGNKHMVVHSWILDGEVYQLTFLNTTFPWQPAKIVLDELLASVKAPEPPQDLLEALPQAQLFLSDDSPWVADTSVISAADFILKHADSSASLSVTGLEMGEMEVIEDWLLEVIVEQNTDRIPGVRALESKWIPFKGKPSAYTDLEVSKADQKMRVMVILYKELTFIVVIASDSEDWQKALPAALEVLDAIEFS